MVLGFVGEGLRVYGVYMGGPGPQQPRTCIPCSTSPTPANSEQLQRGLCPLYPVLEASYHPCTCSMARVAPSYYYSPQVQAPGSYTYISMNNGRGRACFCCALSSSFSLALQLLSPDGRARSWCGAHRVRAACAGTCRYHGAGGSQKEHPPLTLPRNIAQLWSSASRAAYPGGGRMCHSQAMLWPGGTQEPAMGKTKPLCWLNTSCRPYFAHPCYYVSRKVLFPL